MPSDAGPTVLFQVRTGGLSRPRLVRFAARLRKEVAKGRPFCCLITSDAELRRLNREFRAKDYPADVLSFPSGGSSDLGEIAISMDRAREQAREFKHSVENELCILMTHGALHLTGMDHERDNGRMARAELSWRKRFGLPAGLIERVSDGKSGRAGA